MMPSECKIERGFILIQPNEKLPHNSHFLRKLMPKERPSSMIIASGGIMEERNTVKPPAYDAFYLYSYKGDLEGWKTYVQYCCIELHKLLYATFEDNAILISDGRRYLLSECNVEIY